MKKKPFPTDKEIKRVLKKIESKDGSKMLEPGASTVDRLKFDLCESFIIYKQEHKLTQKDLADKLDLDPALMSKILHYRFEDFTIDRLVRFLEILHKSISIKIA